MKEYFWITKDALVNLHNQTVAEHGGIEGLRDNGLLESILARPRHLHEYENVTDSARLAAAYAFGLVRNHPFADGNKRAAFLSIGIFLAINGKRLAADKSEAAKIILSLAAGTVSETELTAWTDAHLQSPDIGTP